MALSLYIAPVLSTAVADNLETSELTERAQFYVSRMDAMHEKMVSGRVECKGTRTFYDARSGEKLASEGIAIECVFDESASRFDRTDGTATSTTVVKDGFESVYTPSQGTIVKRNTGQLPVTPERRAFDVRDLGQMAAEELDLGLSRDWLRETLKNASLDDVHEADGVCQVSWVYQNPFPKVKAQIRRTVWIDSRRGFAPVKVEMRARPDQGDWNSLNPISSAEAEWNEVNRTWIPTSCLMKSAYGSMVVDLHLEWRGVNGDVAPEELSIASFQPKSKTRIVDETSRISALESVTRESAAASHQNQRRWSTLPAVLMAVACLLILVVAIASALRVRSRRSG